MNKIIERIISHKKLYVLTSMIKVIKNDEVAERVWGVWQDKDEIVIKHFGDEYPGKIIYMININDDQGGFFAQMRWVCTLLLYADRRGFIPYIKIGSKSRYYEAGITSTNNPFEYYFQMVSEVRGETIARAQNIIYSELKHLKEVQTNVSFQMEPVIVKNFSYIWKKYIHFNFDTNLKIEEGIRSLGINNKKTIGVHVRGTDFKQNYNGHPIAVPVEEELKIVKEAMEKYKYEQVFVATDEFQTIELFKKEFGNKVVYYQDTYRSRDGVAVHDSVGTRKLHHYMLGLEVLRDVQTLAICKGFVAGQSNVSFFAMIINRAGDEPYEFCYICDKGMNHNKNHYKKR